MTAPIHPMRTITSTQTSFVPLWYKESSGTRIASTSAQIQNASPAMVTAITTTISAAKAKLSISTVGRLAPWTPPAIAHPSEPERALRAVVLGLVLGALLALVGRRQSEGSP